MAERFVRDGEVWKACTKCGVEKPHDAEHYYRSGRYPDGSWKYYSRCKACRKAEQKVERRERSADAHERTKRRLRARQRAWVRLGQRYPKELRRLYEEELVQEYLNHGPMPPRPKRGGRRG